MKATLKFNSLVLDPSLILHVAHSVVKVNRSDTDISFVPDPEVIKTLDAFLITSGIDNEEVRKAMITWKVITTIGNMIDGLANELADRYFHRAIVEHNDYVNGMVDKLAEALVKVRNGEILDEIYSKAKSEDV